MRNVFSWIVKLTITSGILYYIFTTIPFSEVIKSIASANISYIVFAVLIIPFILFITGYQMRILTDKQGMSFSTRNIVEINLITRFYGLFLPGSLSGGAIKWYKLSRPENKPAQALASVAFNRLIETITLVVLGALFWVLDRPFGSNHMIGVLLIAILTVLIVTHFLVFNGTISNFLTEYLRKFNLSFIPRLVRDKAGKLLHSINRFHSLSRELLIYIYCLNLISHLLGILSFYLFALSLGIDLSFISFGWIRSFIAVITMIPISISGLGIREGGLIFLLQPYGVSATEAVALSFLSFTRVILVGVVGGSLEARNLFSSDRRSKSEG